MNYTLVSNEYTADYLQNLLKERGVEDFQSFMHPTPSMLEPIEHFENLPCGAEMYLEVIKKSGSILLIPDCDVDGMTSAAIFYLYTRRCNLDVKIDFMIHEHKQHGLEDHIDAIENSGKMWDLVCCPDSSTNDFDYHERLGALGMKTLVLDHHELDNKVSNHACIINNQTSSLYTNKQLTGAGVTWKFCQYIDKIQNTNYADGLIDLAALGIIGDMGSVVVPENRYIISKGLHNISNFFLKSLIEKQSFVMGEITPISVAFYIVPLINSLIRAGTHDEKIGLFQAFCSGEELVQSDKRGAKPGDTESLAAKYVRKCSNSRNRQNSITEKAEAAIESRIIKYDLLNNKILVIILEDEDDFAPEFNGLIATQLSKEFMRPTLVLRPSPENLLRGSGRGIDNNLFKSFKDFLDESKMFEMVQGHANAFGAAIKAKNLDKFISYANDHLKDFDFSYDVYEVNFDRLAVSNDLYNLIYDLAEGNETWGTGNPEPKIHVYDINIPRRAVNICGQHKDTIRFCCNGITYIKFHAKDLVQQFTEHEYMTIEVIGRGNVNEWNGQSTPQIIIEQCEIKKDNGF